MSQTPASVLLPYQQRWLEDGAQVRICEKSRRVGLSWAMAAEAALVAGTAKGMAVWYIGYNKDMALEFILDCAQWAKQYEVAASSVEEELLKDEDRDIQTFRIRFASGWRVTALSSRPSNLRGKQGMVVIDEAAFHESLPELLKAAIALLMWGGRVCVISTHNGSDNSFAELVEDTRSAKLPYSLHRIPFEEAVAEGLYERICLRQNRSWSLEKQQAWKAEIRAFYGAAAEEELDCVPRGSAGGYLPRAVVAQCMQPHPVLRWACTDAFALSPETDRAKAVDTWLELNVLPLLALLDPEVATAYGLDFARSGDLSVLAIFQAIHGRAVCLLVLELRNVPFREQERVLFGVVDRLPRFQAGAHDARGNGQYLAEVALQRYGARVEPVMFTAEWYRQHMPPFKAAFEDRGIEVPQDGDLLADLRAIEVHKDTPKVGERRYRGVDGGWRHGDGAIALLLGWHALQSEPVEMAYQICGTARIDRELKTFWGQ